MQTYQASCIFDGKATLAEGPGWDEERQAIVWVDIEKGKISRFYPSTHRNETCVSVPTPHHTPLQQKKMSVGTLMICHILRKWAYRA